MPGIIAEELLNASADADVIVVHLTGTAPQEAQS